MGVAEREHWLQICLIIIYYLSLGGSDFGSEAGFFFGIWKGIRAREFIGTLIVEQECLTMIPLNATRLARVRMLETQGQSQTLLAKYRLNQLSSHLTLDNIDKSPQILLQQIHTALRRNEENESRDPRSKPFHPTTATSYPTSRLSRALLQTRTPRVTDTSVKRPLASSGSENASMPSSTQIDCRKSAPFQAPYRGRSITPPTPKSPRRSSRATIRKVLALTCVLGPVKDVRSC
jgi:hypothetical protein